MLGSPEPPLNCNSSLVKSHTLDIKCDPGFDGGLPQEFTLILVNNNIKKVIMNKTSIIPSFSIQGKKYGEGKTDSYLITRFIV